MAIRIRIGPGLGPWIMKGPFLVPAVLDSAQVERPDWPGIGLELAGCKYAGRQKIGKGQQGVAFGSSPQPLSYSTL